MCGETLKGIDPSLMSLNSIKIFVSLKKIGRMGFKTSPVSDDQEGVSF